jgi:hypothetical protein
MNDSLTMSYDFHVMPQEKGRKAMANGHTKPKPPGRIPRVAKLMALAIRFEKLIADGVVKNYADLARLGRVSRARLTQIQNLRLLAPDIQEALLFMPTIERGHDPMTIAELQSIALKPDWKQQWRMWQYLSRRDAT